MKHLTAFLVILLFCLPAFAAPKILATVNDAVITSEDVAQRKKLMRTTDPRLFEGLQNADQVVLDLLIDEAVKRTEAKNEKIDASAAEIEEAVYEIDKRSGKKKGAFLAFMKENDIDEQALRNYLVSDIVWVKLVKKKFGSLAPISDPRADEELNKIAEKNKQTHYLIGEIFLPVQTFAKNRQVLAQANDLIDDLHGGGNFQRLARQYSKAPSAARGGELGYVTAGDLPKGLVDTVRHMKVGDLSSPVFAEGGYYILYLADQKEPPIMKTLPTREQVKNSLFAEFMDNAASSYFEDLKRRAVIIYK